MVIKGNPGDLQYYKKNHDHDGNNSKILPQSSITNLETDISTLETDVSQAAPIGSVQMYAGATSPTGWLICDNSAVSRSTYAALFAIIGITYGSGDGSTTFNLPDCRGVFVRGAGTSAKLSNANGTAFTGTLGAYQNDKGQGHLHLWTPQTVMYGGTPTNPGVNLNGGPSAPPPVFCTNNGSGYTAATPRNTASPGTDGTNGTPRTGAETNPANIALNYIIKF